MLFSTFLPLRVAIVANVLVGQNIVAATIGIVRLDCRVPSFVVESYVPFRHGSFGVVEVVVSFLRVEQWSLLVELFPWHYPPLLPPLHWIRKHTKFSVFGFSVPSCSVAIVFSTPRRMISFESDLSEPSFLPQSTGLLVWN